MSFKLTQTLIAFLFQTTRDDGSKSAGAADAGTTPARENGSAGVGAAESTPSLPPPASTASHPSRELLEEILQQPGPYPMVLDSC